MSNIRLPLTGMSLKAKKDFFRQICKTVGHAELKPSGRCSRCQQKLPLVGYELIGMTIYNSAGIKKFKFNVEET